MCTCKAHFAATVLQKRRGNASMGSKEEGSSVLDHPAHQMHHMPGQHKWPSASFTLHHALEELWI